MHIKKQLHEVYPNIQGQLGSQRAHQISKLLSQFNTIYSQKAQSIVIVKGVVQLISAGNFKMSMGIQKNTCICFSKLREENKLYFNSNLDESEIIIDKKGKIIEGKSTQFEDIGKIYEAAIDDLSLNKTNGGILYMHSNLKHQFSSNQCTVLGIYLAFLHMNSLINQYTPIEMINKLKQFKIFSQIVNQRYFKYQYNKLIIEGNNFYSYFDADYTQKMIFYQIDDYYKKIYQNQYLVNCKNIEQYFSKLMTLDKIDLESEQISTNLTNILSINMQQNSVLCKMIISQLQKIFIVKEAVQRKIEMRNLFIEISKIQKTMLPNQLIKYIQEITNNLNQTPSFLTQCGKYLVFLCKKGQASENLRILSQIKIKRKKQQNNPQQLLQMERKWSNKYNIRNQIFTSCPSSVIDILQPKNDIELDDLI